MTAYIKRLIIGSGSVGLGALLTDPDNCLLIERSATIIAESNGAFQPGTWENLSISSPLSQSLYDEFEQRGIVTERGVHVPGLAAVLWRRLKPLQKHCLFLSTILSVKKENGYYLVHLHNAGGHRRIRCNEIIDCTDSAQSSRAHSVPIRERALHLNMHHPDGGADISNIAHCIPGAFPNEAIMRVPLTADTSWVAARKFAHQQWLQRSPALRPWQCIAIANAFAQKVTALGEIDEQWQHVPACNSDNILAGIELGESLVKAATHV